MRFWDLVFLRGAGSLGNPCYGVQAFIVNFSLSSFTLHFKVFCESKAALLKTIFHIPTYNSPCIVCKCVVQNRTMQGYWKKFEFHPPITLFLVPFTILILTFTSRCSLLILKLPSPEEKFTCFNNHEIDGYKMQCT